MKWGGARPHSYIDGIKLNDMNLTIEDLKLIRLSLGKVNASAQVWETIKVVDVMLAEHNLKPEYESQPKRKYARRIESKLVFNPIK
jgi:hypothetical protein